MRWLIGTVAALGLATGCGDDGASGGTEGSTATSGGTSVIVICTPGDEIACSCPGSPPSVQVCRPDGSAFGPCECPGVTSLPPSDSSSSSSGIDPSLPPTITATTATTLSTSDTLGTGGESTTCADGCGTTGTGSGTTGGTGTTGTTGGMAIAACDPWMPACPVGEACKPYSTLGTTEYDANGCFAIVGGPGQVGDVCTPTAPGSGEDGCDLGLFCAFVDATGDGVCVEQCGGTPMAPTCADPGNVCIQLSAGVLNLCLPACDPLLQDCPGGQGCYPTTSPPDDPWACFADMSGIDGTYGDPCMTLDACDPGHVCLDAASVPGCLGVACCSPLCDTNDPGSDASCAAFDPALACVDWYAPGMAPMGLGSVGVCATPP